MNRLKKKYCVRVILAMLLLCIGIGTVGCQSHKLKRMYTFPYYEATIDDLPPVDEIQAIIITAGAPPYGWDPIAVVGNRAEIENLLGHRVWAKWMVDNREWIEITTKHFKYAERDDAEDIGMADMHAIFITASKGYAIPLTQSGSVIIGTNFHSERILSDINRLGCLEKQKNAAAPKVPADFFTRTQDDTQREPETAPAPQWTPNLTIPSGPEGG
jgi:hypothetical protein